MNNINILGRYSDFYLMFIPDITSHSSNMSQEQIIPIQPHALAAVTQMVDFIASDMQPPDVRVHGHHLVDDVLHQTERLVPRRTDRLRKVVHLPQLPELLQLEGKLQVAEGLHQRNHFEVVGLRQVEDGLDVLFGVGVLGGDCRQRPGEGEHVFVLQEDGIGAGFLQDREDLLEEADFGWGAFHVEVDHSQRRDEQGGIPVGRVLSALGLPCPSLLVVGCWIGHRSAAVHLHVWQVIAALASSIVYGIRVST